MVKKDDLYITKDLAMVQTITVDIINQKALKLLQDLEQLQLNTSPARRCERDKNRLEWV